MTAAAPCPACQAARAADAATVVLELHENSRVLVAAGTTARIPPTMFRLLWRLSAASGVVPWDALIGAIHPDPDREPDYAQTGFHVMRTRLKDRCAAAGIPFPLETVPGVGLRVAAGIELRRYERVPA